MIRAISSSLLRSSRTQKRSNFRFYSSKKSEVVVVTSGKGGVGKTTTAANIAYGLADKGFKTCVIDFDIGLRNLDLHLGMERRVIFDFVNVLKDECTLQQALIRDKKNPNLYLLAASQTRDKTVLTLEGVEKILEDLKPDFDYILCDSPAGIESGAHHAMYFSDQAIICTNPELSSCRDSDKMLGIIASKSKRACEGLEPIKPSLMITRYLPERVEAEEMLSVNDIEDLLGIPLIGVIPDSPEIIKSTNLGRPAITNMESDVAKAYEDSVCRFVGEEREWRFLKPKNKSFFSKIVSKFS